MRHSTRSGMSPAELLIALLVVVALAFGFVRWVNVKAENDKRKLTIRRMLELEAGLQRYCADCAGALPNDDQDLDALCTAPTKPPVPKGWAGPYVPEATVSDGWGRRFHYVYKGGFYPGTKLARPYDLSSYGRDGREGGRGLDRDIRNWERETMVP